MLDLVVACKANRMNAAKEIELWVFRSRLVIDADTKRHKKWQTEHRTATTAYPCYLPVLGEFSRSWSCQFAVTKIGYSKQPRQIKIKLYRIYFHKTIFLQVIEDLTVQLDVA